MEIVWKCSFSEFWKFRVASIAVLVIVQWLFQQLYDYCSDNLLKLFRYLFQESASIAISTCSNRLFQRSTSMVFQWFFQ